MINEQLEKMGYNIGAPHPTLSCPTPRLLVISATVLQVCA